MKQLLIFLALLPWWVFGQTSPTAQYKTVPDMIAAPIPVINSRLSAIVTGRLTTNDGGGGLFFYESTSAGMTNPGTVFKPASTTGRWVRQFADEFNVKWFGAFPDDSVDDTTLLQGIFAMDKDVYFPQGDYNTSGTLTITNSRAYRFDPGARIMYTGNGTALYVTAVEAELTDWQIQKSVRNFAGPSIGLLVDNSARRNWSVRVAYFTTGISLNADSAAKFIGYNKMRLVANSCLTNIFINVSGGGGITSTEFDSLVAVGDTPVVANSKGIYITSTGPSLTTLTFIAPVVENNEVGVYINTSNFGFEFINGDFEGNTDHFKTGPLTDKGLKISGGLFSSPSIPFKDTAAIANTNLNPIVIVNDPNQYNDLVFFGDGLYRARSQGFRNLLPNGRFDAWETNSQPKSWQAVGLTVTQDVANAESGPWAAKLWNGTGATAYFNGLGITSFDFLTNRWVTVVAKVRATQASTARVVLSFGAAGDIPGDFHTGGGAYEYLTASAFVHPATTLVRPYIQLSVGATNTYVDYVAVFEGRNFSRFLQQENEHQGPLAHVGANEMVSYWSEGGTDAMWNSWYRNNVRKGYYGFPNTSGDFEIKVDDGYLGLSSASGVIITNNGAALKQFRIYNVGRPGDADTESMGVFKNSSFDAAVIDTLATGTGVAKGIELRPNGFVRLVATQNQVVIGDDDGALANPSRTTARILGTYTGTNYIFGLETESTGSGTTQYMLDAFIHHAIATTDATVATLGTIPIVSNRTYMIESNARARRSSGVAGTADDGAVYIRRALVTTKAGVVTINAVQDGLTQEDQAAWDYTFDVSGANIRLRVTGAANNSISWHETTRVSYVGQ